MKTRPLTVISAALIIAGTTSSFGQDGAGELRFANTPATPILVFDSTTGTAAKIYGSTEIYEFGLYMGPAASTLLSQMQLVDTFAYRGPPTPTSGLAGIIDGGVVISPGYGANPTDFLAGTTYAFYVAGWTSADGSTYNQALASEDPAGYAGISALGSVTPLAYPASPAPNLFGTSVGQIGGFTLYGTPEPATLALGGLGAALLLLFRRRE